MNIEEFIESLKYPSNLNSYFNNPWKEEINLNNLKNFLKKDAKYILIGEAPGRKGCLQCGVPFCDDYTLEKIIKVSNTKIRKVKEESAQRIYLAFKDDFIAWNAFPYQPCKKDGQNRTPNKYELKYGQKYLKTFLDIFNENNKKTIIALGNKAEAACNEIKAKYIKVIHPSQFADIKRKKLGYNSGREGWLTYIQNEIPTLKNLNG